MYLESWKLTEKMSMVPTLEKSSGTRSISYSIASWAQSDNVARKKAGKNDRDRADRNRVPIFKNGWENSLDLILLLI